MSPFPWISAGVAVASLARKCPKCGRRQPIRTRARHATVTCVSCGARIPPVPRKKGQPLPYGPRK